MMIREIWNAYRRPIKHLAISTALVLFASGLLLGLQQMSHNMTLVFERNIVPLDSLDSKLPAKAFSNCADTLIHDYEKLVIRYLYGKATKATHFYYDVADTYFEYHFAFLVVGQIMVIFAGIMLLFLIRTGYSSANEFVVNLLITSSALSIMTLTLPKILKNEENFNTSVYFFDHYNSLRNKIYSYSAKCTCINSDSLGVQTTGTPKFPTFRTVKANEFIHFLELDFKNNFQIPVGMDPGKVSTIEAEGARLHKMMGGS